MVKSFLEAPLQLSEEVATATELLVFPLWALQAEAVSRLAAVHMGRAKLRVVAQVYLSVNLAYPSRSYQACRSNSTCFSPPKVEVWQAMMYQLVEVEAVGLLLAVEAADSHHMVKVGRRAC